MCVGEHHAHRLVELDELEAGPRQVVHVGRVHEVEGAAHAERGLAERQAVPSDQEIHGETEEMRAALRIRLAELEVVADVALGLPGAPDTHSLPRPGPRAHFLIQAELLESGVQRVEEENRAKIETVLIPVDRPARGPLGDDVCEVPFGEINVAVVGVRGECARRREVALVWSGVVGTNANAIVGGAQTRVEAGLADQVGIASRGAHGEPEGGDVARAEGDRRSEVGEPAFRGRTPSSQSKENRHAGHELSSGPPPAPSTPISSSHSRLKHSAKVTPS